jgi:hypothetical protein
VGDEGDETAAAFFFAIDRSISKKWETSSLSGPGTCSAVPIAGGNPKCIGGGTVHVAISLREMSEGCSR